MHGHACQNLTCVRVQQPKCEPRPPSVGTAVGGSSAPLAGGQGSSDAATRAAPDDVDSIHDAKAVLTIANENGAEPLQPATSPTVPQQQGARNTNVLLTQPATAMHTNDPCAPSADHDRSESGTTIAPSKATTVLASSGGKGGGGSTGAGHTADSSTHASPGTSSDMCTEPAFQTDDSWPTKRRSAALNSGYV